VEKDTPGGLWICLSVRGCILRWVTRDGGVMKNQLGKKWIPDPGQKKRTRNGENRRMVDHSVTLQVVTVGFYRNWSSVSCRGPPLSRPLTKNVYY
jgi:hypothetical protein